MPPGETNSNQTEEETIESLQAEYDTLFNGLKPQRQQFVSEYQACLNVKKAAIAAGYSSHTAIVQGSRMLRKGTTALLIKLSQRLLALRSRLSQDWVLNELKINYERCMQAKPVLDKKGTPTGEYTYNANAANRALELIGQHLGMFGKGEKEKGNLHLHKHYVNYPPVPASISEWVDQMREVGYDAALPEHGEDTEDNVTPVTSKEEGKDEQGQNVKVREEPHEDIEDTPQGEESETNI